jgi:predicted transglutaminase-like cysteine proteinase
MFSTTLAQGKHGKGKERSAEERATAQTKHLTKKLGLNQEQQTKIQAINLTANQKVDALQK